MNAHVNSIEEDHVISAVSRSLEDALEAALRGAFEVALRIAVNDVSRLMGQALQDVKHQIHETQQENISLKLRLEQIHAEQDNKPKQQTADPNQSSIKSDKLHEDTDENNTKDDIQHIKSSDQDTLSFHSGFEQVQVKIEKTEAEETVLDGNSVYGSDARPDYSFDQRSNEEFGLDRLTLAQSKLLEDWRPDSEQQQNETEPLDPSSSLGTSGISLSPSGCASSFSTSLDRLHQSADQTSFTQSTQSCTDQVGTKVQYVCKFCGDALHSENGLHNHHLQYHKTVLKRAGEGDNNATTAKQQKQQLPPPQCSMFHCIVCNQEFNCLKKLGTHFLSHSGEGPFTCSLCGARLLEVISLKSHFRIHAFECLQCGRHFKKRKALLFHLRAHNLA